MNGRISLHAPIEQLGLYRSTVSKCREYGLSCVSEIYDMPLIQLAGRVGLSHRELVQVLKRLTDVVGGRA